MSSVGQSRTNYGVRVDFINGDSANHPEAKSVEIRESEYLIEHEHEASTIVARDNVANIEIGPDVRIID